VSIRADVAGSGTELGAAFQQGLELGPLVFGQGVGMAGEPAGDLADGRRWWRRERCFGGAVLLEVGADGGVAAGVAQRLDLPEQLGNVAAAFVCALVQVGLERVQHAGTRGLPAAVDEFLPGLGVRVALHSVPSPAQMAGDRPHPVPFGQQFVHHRVVPAGSLGELPARLWLRDMRRLSSWLGSWSGNRPGGRFAQAGAVRGDAPLDRLGEVLPQVEAVGDLDRAGRSGAGAV
jgi:hypothetical protein